MQKCLQNGSAKCTVACMMPEPFLPERQSAFSLQRVHSTTANVVFKNSHATFICFIHTILKIWVLRQHWKYEYICWMTYVYPVVGKNEVLGKIIWLLLKTHEFSQQAVGLHCAALETRDLPVLLPVLAKWINGRAVVALFPCCPMWSACAWLQGVLVISLWGFICSAVEMASRFFRITVPKPCGKWPPHPLGQHMDNLREP